MPSEPPRCFQGRVRCSWRKPAHWGGQGLTCQIPACCLRGQFLHVLNLGFPIRQIGVGAPFDTRGPALLQILVGQLAASQETYFNYHKSLGLFPFIFNGLCMYHLMQMTYSKVLSFYGVFFQSAYLSLHMSLCMHLCGWVCVISYKRYQLLSLTHLWPCSCSVLGKTTKTKISKIHNCWGGLSWHYMNKSDIYKPTKTRIRSWRSDTSHICFFFWGGGRDPGRTREKKSWEEAECE